MPKTYFTADLHLGHHNIIKYCARPFSDVTEMDECLISNWNSVVKAEDTVYILGDFSFSQSQEQFNSYIRALEGRKLFIKGNHDKPKYFKDIFPHYPLEDSYLLSTKGRKLWLSHYAHRVWPMSHNGSWHLYGHSHGTLKGTSTSLDVGVDAWNYFPVSFEELEQYFNSWTHLNDIPKE